MEALSFGENFGAFEGFILHKVRNGGGGKFESFQRVAAAFGRFGKVLQHSKCIEFNVTLLLGMP